MFLHNWCNVSNFYELKIPQGESCWFRDPSDMENMSCMHKRIEGMITAIFAHSKKPILLYPTPTLFFKQIPPPFSLSLCFALLSFFWLKQEWIKNRLYISLYNCCNLFYLYHSLVTFSPYVLIYLYFYLCLSLIPCNLSELSPVKVNFLSSHGAGFTRLKVAI